MSDVLISTDKNLLQLDRVHRFLSEKAYWCLGIPFETVKFAAQNSLTYGVYQDSVQIGYARVITDYATFAWLSDVYVEDDFRGQGLSKKLVERIMEDLKPYKLRRTCLATKDAHTLYLKYGFKVTETPQNWMEIKNNEIYKQIY